MKLQPTASRSEVLTHCSYWVGKDVPREETSQAAEYGSAFHSAMAELLMNAEPDYASIASQYGLNSSIQDELQGHVSEAFLELNTWLKNNWLKIDFSKGDRFVEKAMCLGDNTAGWIRSPDENHVYTHLEDGDVAGTADLIINTKDYILVLDHKTGADDFSSPSKIEQLLTLGAAAWIILGFHKKLVLAVLAASRKGITRVYAEKVDPKITEDHIATLEDSMKQVNTGYMRPGAWCSRCPGRSVCPAYGGQLTRGGVEVLQALTASGSPTAAIVPGNSNDLTMPRERRLGLLYEVVQQSEKMTKQARDEIRREMQETGILPETSKGYLNLRSHMRESVSKSSILEAMGKLKGEKILNELREAGAVKQTEVVQLVQEKERG